MYQSFATIYDRVMNEIPYEEWFEKIREFLTQRGITDGTVCELGCGTGTMTELLAGVGYHMLGVDVSPEMLALARMKQEESHADILYIEQSMDELALPEPVDAMISVCDSINYLLDEEQLERLFNGVNRFLKPGGFFLFDVKTAYCYREIIGDRTWAEQDEDFSYIWENYYYDDRDINEYLLTIFTRRENGLYEKSEEAHYQRAYDIPLLKKIIEAAGLTVETVYGGDLEGEPDTESERYYFVISK